MQQQQRRKLFAEALEDRSVPSVTANLVGGSLLVSGSATTAGDTISVKETGAGQFQVFDGSTQVGGTFTLGSTGNVVVKLGSADDNVAIDLGGNTTPNSVLVALGGGANSLSVANGTVAGSLAVSGGSGADTVALGGSAGALTVNGGTGVALDGGTDDLTLNDNATVGGNLATAGIESVTLASGSSVGGSAYLLGGSAGSTVSVAGNVARDILLAAPWWQSTAPSSLEVSGTVGGSVLFASSLINSGSTGNSLNVSGSVTGSVAFLGTNLADTVNVADAASIGGYLAAATYGGNDTVTVGNATVGKGVALALGAGDDTATINGTIGSGSGAALFVDAGSGGDSVTLGANLKGDGYVYMGAGDDTFTRGSSASFTNLTVNGGTGTDTYVGDKTGVNVSGFEA